MGIIDVKEELNAALGKCSVEIADIASKILKKPIYVYFNRQDQLRLLNLKIWANKYKLPLEEILRLLLSVWMGKFKASRRKGLVVPISTLVGKKSNDILLDYLAKKYPNRENITLRKQDLVSKIIPEAELKEWDDPIRFVYEYKQHIKALRAGDAKIAAKFRRRHWRGNPWL